MAHARRSASGAFLAGFLTLGIGVALAGCAGTEVTGSGTGGSSAAGTGGPGTAGTTGTTGIAGTTGTTGVAGTTGTTGVAGTTGTTGVAGTTGTTGTAGTTATAGTTGTTGRGGTTGTAGTTGVAGTTGAAGRGGATGTAGRGGTTGTAGTGAAGTYGSGGMPALNCGPMAQVIESHGPPANRVNYIIVGDGYSQAELTTTLITHVNNYMTRRFSAPIGVPYDRYRNFFNICVLQVPSTPICGSSQFGCCGNDSSRLASCNDSAVNAAIKQYIPTTIPVDFKAVVLNGSSWWNSGGMLMYWSGGNKDAPGAAMHEGSHGFHQLADEYGDCTGAQCGSNTNFSGSAGTVYAEVNSCGNPTTTDGKWIDWMGYNAADSTGMVGTWSGSRYVGTGQYRPSANSTMNSLFGNDKNTSFNPVTRQQIAEGMYRFVKPIDSTVPAAGAVTNPGVITVNVIDPVVISVDWTVDGTVKTNGGITFDTSTLAAGSHTISAKAYDNADNTLVRTKTCPSSVTGVYCHAKNWANSVQTVTWTVTKS